MALRVWLPLNGNLENKGLSKIILPTTNLNTYENGKIGQCLSLNNNSQSFTVSELEGLKKFTICFWIKSKSDETRTSDWNQMLQFGCKTSEGESSANLRFESTYTYDVRACSFHNNATYGITSSSWVIVRNMDEWHHVTFSCDGTKIYTYLDGSNRTEGTCNGGSLTGTIIIGSNKYLGCINDLRVYDECLSDKQIKEISKGLVCHYKLEGHSINNNLAKKNPLINAGANSIFFDEITNTYKIVSPVGDNTWGYGVNIGTTNKCLVPYNSFYRFSFEVYVPTQHVLVVDYNNFSNDTSQWNPSGNDNDLTSVRLTNTKTIPGGVWTKCIFGSKNANTNNTAQVDLYETSKIGLRTESDTEAVTWYLRNFKFELGQEATDWVSHSYNWDESLTTDVSGNGYNIIKNGTLTFNTDSPRYSGSLNFPGINTNYLYRPKFDWLTAPFTFNCWCNQTSRTAEHGTGTTTLQFIESQGRDCGYGGFSLCLANGVPRLYLGTSTSGTYYSLNSDTALDLNTWHMLTGTYDGATAKLYVDGILKATKDSDAEISWAEATGFVIGKMAYSYTTTTYYFPFAGSINDVRVYATALSADEILTMYKTSGIIDNKNNIYTYEFKEE